MIGKLSPEDRVMDYKTEIYSQVANVIKELGWDENDNIAVEVGGAFAMMWANVQSINNEMRTPRKPQHPEAPKEGDELLYVDLTKERLENLYDQ